MDAVKIQPPQLSVERGAAHAKRFGRCLHIALGTHERSLQHPSLRHGKVFCNPV